VVDGGRAEQNSAEQGRAAQGRGRLGWAGLCSNRVLALSRHRMLVAGFAWWHVGGGGAGAAVLGGGLGWDGMGEQALRGTNAGVGYIHTSCSSSSGGSSDS
jgi:hypothetical protein